jgi:hypothetical protein
MSMKSIACIAAAAKKNNPDIAPGFFINEKPQKFVP